MKLALDASVLVEWLLADPDREPGTQHAASLMEAVAAGQVVACQPPHWLAEVAAVLSRLSPATAATDIRDLYALEFDVVDHLAVYHRAARLALDLDQHVFDTLYHAVALETDGCTLVTADERYFRRAASAGRITLLERWREASCRNCAG